jgi:hypothetical protein
MKTIMGLQIIEFLATKSCKENGFLEDEDHWSHEDESVIISSMKTIMPNYWSLEDEDWSYVEILLND